MRPADEIKNGLECCSNVNFVCNEECPYYKSLSEGEDCCLKKNADALALIKQLQAENDEKDQRIRQLVADLEDMTARYKIADDCAKKKGEMNEKLYAELAAVKAERDAAVESMRKDPHCCFHCKHKGKWPSCNSDPRPNGSCFEWRGVQKEG